MSEKMIRTTYVADSGGGVARRTNQDNFCMNGMAKPVETRNYRIGGTSVEPCQVFAVCDGMGGEQAGEIAAALAVEALQERTMAELCQDWSGYITAANDKICAYQKEHQLNMGTTFAGLFLREGQVQAVNVGDSRVYRIRGGKLEQLSKDHNHVQTMIDAGILTQEIARHHKARNQLTQHLGIEPSEMELDPFVTEWEPVQSEDRYLLCSDGLCEGLTDEEMMQVMQSEPSLTDCCRNLIACAEKQGSRDNITVLLIGVSEEKERKPVEQQKNGIKKVPNMQQTQALALLEEQAAELPQQVGKIEMAGKLTSPYAGKRCKKSKGRLLAEWLGLRQKEEP